jgi:integration host factor subunit beta
MARRPQLGWREAERLVNATFEAMAGTLEQGERIELRGFGSFGIKSRDARQGRNPRTGAVVAVPAKAVLFFRPAKELRSAVAPIAADRRAS